MDHLSTGPLRRLGVFNLQMCKYREKSPLLERKSSQNELALRVDSRNSFTGETFCKNA